MRLLITGSKGLIGSALCNDLRLLGIEVLGLDIRWSPEHSEYGDVLNFQLINGLAKKVDGIVHLAGVSRVIFGERNPDLCWKTNVEGTKNVIESAIDSPTHPWIIYASSREVYGEQHHLPVEESAPLQPVNVYGESKVEAESIILAARNKGLSTAVLRFSNVYGSTSDHEDRVIPAFCYAAAFGKEIRVEGKNNLFDFTYIEDVINGILSTICYLSTQSPPLPPIHLTTGVPTSLKQIAEIAFVAGGKRSRVVEKPSRSFDVAKFYGDTKRAKELLGWCACVDIQSGMHRLINRYRLYQPSEVTHQEKTYAFRSTALVP